MKAEFEKRGLGYRMVLVDISAEITVDQLSRSRGELHGEITVVMAMPGTRSADGHLHQAHMNLSSAETRSRLAKMLAARAGTRDEIDWIDVLENFCRAVLAAERDGEAVIRVGNLPLSVKPEFRIDPIVQQGKPMILYGEGGTGKSTIAAALAVSSETGVAVIPGFVPRKAPAMYLDWEADKDDLNDRVRRIAMGTNMPGPASILYRPCHGPLYRQIETIIRTASKEGVGLVIVDSVALAAGVGSEGGDAAETAVKLFSAFRALTVAVPGCAIVAVHHISKSEAAAEGKPSKPYGSIYFENLARCTFELRAGANSTVALYNNKSNNAKKLPPIAFHVQHDEDGGPIAYTRLDQLPDDLTRSLPLHERMYRILIEEHMSPVELAEVLDEPQNKVRAMLSRHKLLFQRLGSGKWEALPRAS